MRSTAAAPSPAEETSRGPLGATAAVRAGVAGAGARGSRRARPGRKSLAPSWWSARAVRPSAAAVLLTAAKRVPVAEGARAPRWRHGPSHSRPWEEWSRTSRPALPQRPLQCCRARPTRRPMNASSGRTRARSIVAGRVITRLAALHRRCPGGPWLTGGKATKPPRPGSVLGQGLVVGWTCALRPLTDEELSKFIEGDVERYVEERVKSGESQTSLHGLPVSSERLGRLQAYGAERLAEPDPELLVTYRQVLVEV